MGIGVITNFDVSKNVPIDSRSVVADLVARNALNTNVRYEGLSCFVVSEGKSFTLIGGVDNSNWIDTIGENATENENITVQGNIFNGVQQLVKTTEDGSLPRLNAKNLYNTVMQGVGIVIDGVTVSVDFGTESTQVAPGDHTHANLLSSAALTDHMNDSSAHSSLINSKVSKNFSDYTLISNILDSDTILVNRGTDVTSLRLDYLIANVVTIASTLRVEYCGSTRPLTGEANVYYIVDNLVEGSVVSQTKWMYANDSWIDLGNTDVVLSNYYTKEEVYTIAQTISAINSGIATHDASVGAHPSILATLDTKVDKVTGYVLSKNDFTDVYKTKLDNLQVLPQATEILLGGIKLGANLIFNTETGRVDAVKDGYDYIGANGITVTGYTISTDASVTKMGNIFNEANKLVKTNASNQLPSVSGRLLTEIPHIISVGEGLVSSGVQENIGTGENPIWQTVYTNNISFDTTTTNKIRLISLGGEGTGTKFLCDDGTYKSSGISGIAVDRGILGIGSLEDPIRVNETLVTTVGNTFNGINQLVKLNGIVVNQQTNTTLTALPVIDGSALTGICKFISVGEGLTTTNATRVFYDSSGVGYNTENLYTASISLSSDFLTKIKTIKRDGTGTKFLADNGEYTSSGISSTAVGNGLSGDGSAEHPIIVDTAITTTQGNTFNGPNQLLKLTEAGLIPDNKIGNIATTKLTGTVSESNLPKASATVFGIMKLGNNLTINPETNAVDAAGASAYQVWLDDGNTGTVNDFLTTLGTGISLEGEYAPTTPYRSLSTTKDCVEYEGNLWMCKVDGSTNVAPPSLPTKSNTNWELVVSKGEKGDKGDTGSNIVPKGAYVAETVYTSDSYHNDSVSYNGSQWYIKVATATGVTPPSDPATPSDTWELFVAKGDKGDKVEAYSYVRYASDVNGSNISATPELGLSYIAFKSTDAEIADPQASDFIGLWKKYIPDYNELLANFPSTYSLLSNVFTDGVTTITFNDLDVTGQVQFTLLDGDKKVVTNSSGIYTEWVETGLKITLSGVTIDEAKPWTILYGSIAHVSNAIVSLTSNVTFTIGTGGNFTTIKSALQYVSQVYRPADTTKKVTLKLLTGFIVSENNIIINTNLGWIQIDAEDASVVVNSSNWGSDTKLFYIKQGGVCPVINFSMTLNDANNFVTYCFYVEGSLNIKSGLTFSGGNRNGIAIYVTNAGDVIADDITLKNFLTALHVVGGKASTKGLIVRNCINGIRSDDNGSVTATACNIQCSAEGSYIPNTSSYGVRAVGGYINVSGSTSYIENCIYCIHASYGGTINCSSSKLRIYNVNDNHLTVVLGSKIIAAAATALPNTNNSNSTELKSNVTVNTWSTGGVIHR